MHPECWDLCSPRRKIQPWKSDRKLTAHNPLNVARVSHAVEIPSAYASGANEFHLIPEIVRGCKYLTYFDEQKPGYIEVVQMVHCLKKNSKRQPVEALDRVQSVDQFRLRL